MARKPRRTSGRVQGKIVVEGKVRKGGVKAKPSIQKPSTKPAGQRSSPKKK